MIVAFQIPKATDTHSECVLLIVIPVQPCLIENVRMSYYMHVSNPISI